MFWLLAVTLTQALVSCSPPSAWTNLPIGPSSGAAGRHPNSGGGGGGAAPSIWTSLPLGSRLSAQGAESPAGALRTRSGSSNVCVF